MSLNFGFVSDSLCDKEIVSLHTQLTSQPLMLNNSQTITTKKAENICNKISDARARDNSKKATK